jgi:hypothetical protein
LSDKWYWCQEFDCGRGNLVLNIERKFVCEVSIDVDLDALEDMSAMSLLTPAMDIISSGEAL